ncbi:hypothetical protein RUMGNA_00178 [Mediterraneibacter gnavus ATCC 29149]|uniref:Uncharacterized protein n=1 Tax=Mediterraneibacter gnavus (strain ATCC 29149 / DSM 114966 / JCM 6515 / VPI C7-9) TaxID=411470 RepID=A7AY13_MEDG7|nr:hypothetical protein RUMGNA_00178 [Mediterraneibacter gnavus ATCC 29149]
MDEICLIRRGSGHLWTAQLFPKIIPTGFWFKRATLEKV